jgi:hypothetical protein
MRDALPVIQASVTKTATFQSTGANLKATPKRGLAISVFY